MLKLCEQSNQVQCIFLLEAPFTLTLSMLKGFLGGKVQQYGVLLLQIYNMQLSFLYHFGNEKHWLFKNYQLLSIKSVLCKITVLVLI